jgi:drug/metabolite transporter (DMT)-like permease
VSKRGWLLFAAMGVIWGVPYFFIRVAAKQLSPPVVVFGRSSLAAAVLLVVAHRRDMIRPVLARWRPVLAFAVLEMAVPWVLLTDAEQHLPSGLTALLVASVPIVGTIAAFVLGDRSVLRATRLVGIAAGLLGVVLLVGNDLSGDGDTTWWSVTEVLLVCVCYATAPFIADRKLHDEPSIGVIAVSLGIVTVIYAPLAWWARPDETPRWNVIGAVLVLAIVCTGIAFVVFFRFIAEVGAARSTLITFVNPVVAIALGALFLDETITIATAAGFVLVLAGCWLASRSHPAVVAVASAAPVPPPSSEATTSR